MFGILSFDSYSGVGVGSVLGTSHLSSTSVSVLRVWRCWGRPHLEQKCSLAKSHLSLLKTSQALLNLPSTSSFFYPKLSVVEQQ